MLSPGVTDDEEDDKLSGTFFNDMYILDAGKGVWHTGESAFTTRVRPDWAEAGGWWARDEQCFLLSRHLSASLLLSGDAH